ncbi:MAG: DUF2786 domain-containing protein [Microlunatus sp.]|nr:DUF2786 domain-containing protein [Microlunatus sp.]
MRRNIRQRRATKQRAAKQRARTRRGPTPPRAAREEQEAIDDLFGGPLDDLDDHQASSDSSAGYLRPPAGRPSTTRQAVELLDRICGLAGVHGSNDDTLRRMIGAVLTDAPPAVVEKANEMVSARMIADVARLWESGWQPRDLLPVAGRLDRRAGSLAAALSVEQLRRSGRLGSAPGAWREQFDDAADQAQAAGVATVGDWSALDRLLATGIRPESAWSTIARLVVRMEGLPPLVPTLPPPSAWTSSSQSRSRPTPPGAPRPEVTSIGNRDRVLSKIRALLAKAESTEHAAEAEAFTAKAQDLMTRHAIDEALLLDATDNPVAVTSRRVHIDNPYPLEKTRLLTAVGRANRTRVIWMEDLAMATMVGTPVDVDQVDLLFVSLLIQATRAMTEAGATRPGSFDRSPRFRRSFLTSYAVRIGERLTEADRDATASYGSALVPVLRRQEEAVDVEFERLFPSVYQTGVNRTYDRRGWDAGRQAAERAVLVAGRLAS